MRQFSRVSFGAGRQRHAVPSLRGRFADEDEDSL